MFLLTRSSIKYSPYLKAIILLLPWSVVALPCLIVFHRSKRGLCQLGVAIHLIAFLGGWCANLVVLTTPLGKWWGQEAHPYDQH